MGTSLNTVNYDGDLMTYRPTEKPYITSKTRVVLGVGFALAALTAVAATVALLVLFPPASIALGPLGGAAVLGAKVVVGGIALGLMALSAYYFATCRLNALDPKSHR